MAVERIPTSLLKGEFLHCQPVENGPILAAPIIPSEQGSTPTFKVSIICPARISGSRCLIRTEVSDGDGTCHYYRGDSKGEYQIIGPGMDRKTGDGWK